MRVFTTGFVLLLAIVCTRALDCKPTISQTMQTSWTDGNGVQNSIWEVLITVPASSASLSSLVLSVDLDTNNAISQYWEMVQPNPGLGVFVLPDWKVQSGGIPAGQSYKFGYSIRSSKAADFSVSSWNCASSGPSTSPVSGPSPASSPSPALSSSPVASPSPELPTPTGAVCQAVLIIDNYIVRNAPDLSAQEIKDKYSEYFSDVITYYGTNFGIEIDLAYVYVEVNSSFTDEMDGSKLLDDFALALIQNKFGQPAGACIYHLMTGRQPPGIGGLAWVGSACSGYSGPGYAVDGQAREDAELVIRRMIHEIGHNFGGNHPDQYSPSKGYNCSINEDRAYDRILRSPAYKFLSPTAFISDCATLSIKYSLSSYSCMWSQDSTNSVFPKTILCLDPDAEGGCRTVAAHMGLDACYNILNFNDVASSFQLFPGTTKAVGLRLYIDYDCLGGSTDVLQLYSPTLPASIDNQATSFRFIVQ